MTKLNENETEKVTGGTGLSIGVKKFEIGSLVWLMSADGTFATQGKIDKFFKNYEGTKHSAYQVIIPDGNGTYNYICVDPRNILKNQPKGVKCEFFE